MKKLFKNKIFIWVMFLIIPVILIGCSLIMVRDVDLKRAPKDTEVNKEEDNKDLEDKNEYQVIFNSNGGSLISPITVKEGEVLTKPEEPTRDGYTFVNWTLDDEEYNFENVVTSNLVLKAIWEKKKTSSTTTTTTKPSSNTSESKKKESTIDKINLNDYIYFTYNFVNYNDITGYYFITNLGEVLPEFASKKSITMGWDDDKPSSYYQFDIKINEWYAVLDKFTFDTAKENKAKEILEKVKNKNYPGIEFTPRYGSAYPSYTDNHCLNYKYKYLKVGNPVYKTLNSGLESVRNSMLKELSGIFDGAIFVTFPGAAVYDSYDERVSEEICQTFHLTCERW